MRILPVLDLLDGQVVRGIAGRRQDYRPVVSRLTQSSHPLDVARAFRDQFGLTELYVADLDAIAGKEPDWPTFSALCEEGFRLWVDAGVQAASGRLLAEHGAGVIAGLETLAGPNVLAELVGGLGDRLAFSLDLRGGVPLGKTDDWEGADAWSIAAQAVALGVRRLLVLDLARVGVNIGTGTDELCARLAATYPEVAVWAGGGIRGPADLRQLRDQGVQVVLVASALHDGALTRADVDAIDITKDSEYSGKKGT
jgi:phosphoribosylformimino-5-aminoimidazole carboxamide ribotide isomerase